MLGKILVTWKALPIPIWEYMMVKVTSNGESMLKGNLFLGSMGIKLKKQDQSNPCQWCIKI
jgi:hypothetical protein